MKVQFTDNGKAYSGNVIWETNKYLFVEVVDEVRNNKRVFTATDTLGSTHLLEKGNVVELFND